MNNYRYYQNQERCGGLLLPFLAGALVSAPIAYLAGNNNTPEYVFPPQYQYPPQQIQPYPTVSYTQSYNQYQQPIQTPIYQQYQMPMY